MKRNNCNIFVNERLFCHLLFYSIAKKIRILSFLKINDLLQASHFDPKLIIKSCTYRYMIAIYEKFSILFRTAFFRSVLFKIVFFRFVLFSFVSLNFILLINSVNFFVNF